MSLEDTPGYILRVSHDDWVQQIYELNKYYSGIMRHWRIGLNSIFYVFSKKLP